MQAIPHMHNFIDPLPQTVREDIVAASSLREYPQSSFIYRQGDESNALYQLLSGSVRLCNFSAQGREVITGSFVARDCFGELGLIDGLPRVSHALASEDSTLMVLAKSAFDDLYQRHPQISQQLNYMLTLRMRLLYSLSEDMRTLPLGQRLGRMLLYLAQSKGASPRTEVVEVGVSHEQLSQILGASRQSVSKELKALEKVGLIRIEYGKTLVPDLGRLAQACKPALDCSGPDKQ